MYVFIFIIFLWKYLSNNYNATFCKLFNLRKKYIKKKVYSIKRTYKSINNAKLIAPIICIFLHIYCRKKNRIKLNVQIEFILLLIWQSEDIGVKTIKVNSFKKFQGKQF